MAPPTKVGWERARLALGKRIAMRGSRLGSWSADSPAAAAGMWRVLVGSNPQLITSGAALKSGGGTSSAQAGRSEAATVPMATPARNSATCTRSSAVSPEDSTCMMPCSMDRRMASGGISPIMSRCGAFFTAPSWQLAQAAS